MKETEKVDNIICLTLLFIIFLFKIYNNNKQFFNNFDSTQNL